MKTAQHTGFKCSKWILRLLLVCMICAMLFTVFTGVITTSNRVTIHEDGMVYSRYTLFTELEDILKKENIILDENDKCEFTGFADSQADIYITRAFEVPITADGQTQMIPMTDGTVQDALDLAGISLSDDDLINVATNELVTRETEIVINRVTYTQNQFTTEIPYEVQKPEIQLAANQQLITSVEGVAGTLLTTTSTKWIDGVEQETTVVSEEVAVQPIAQEFAVVEEITIGGVKRQVEPGSSIQLDENGNPVNYAYKVTGKATAYSALGKPTSLRPGAVAMNLSQFPKGTKLYIKTPDNSYVYGYSTVRDTGTAVNNGTVLVDCFFNTYEESVRFGAKTVEVYVLE